MKSTQARTPPRLRTALFALSIAAMATQVGGATAAAPMPAEPLARVSAAAIAVPERAALASIAWFTSASRGPPVSGSWALLVAGLVGAWAIGRRRISALGGQSLDPYRSRR